MLQQKLFQNGATVRTTTTATNTGIVQTECIIIFPSTNMSQNHNKSWTMLAIATNRIALKVDHRELLIGHSFSLSLNIEARSVTRHSFREMVLPMICRLAVVRFALVTECEKIGNVVSCFCESRIRRFSSPGNCYARIVVAWPAKRLYFHCTDRSYILGVCIYCNGKRIETGIGCIA